MLNYALPPLFKNINVQRVKYSVGYHKMTTYRMIITGRRYKCVYYASEPNIKSQFVLSHYLYTLIYNVDSL